MAENESREVEKKSNKNVYIDKGSITGPFWVAGWLFTIGYAELTFGQGFLAIVLWPYYLGSVL